MKVLAITCGFLNYWVYSSSIEVKVRIWEKDRRLITFESDTRIVDMVTDFVSMGRGVVGVTIQ